MPAQGITLPNGSTITHGLGANIKQPFNDIALSMHELSPGTRSYGGQLGLIEFTTSYRLPRHVHISPDKQRFVYERILVLDGVALVEMNGELYVIPPKTLVTIAAGVPHTWTACPKGVVVGNEVEAQGRFLMVYEYEEPTAFYPTKQTGTMGGVSEYVKCEDLEAIRIPLLSRDEVNQRCFFVWNEELKGPGMG